MYKIVFTNGMTIGDLELSKDQLTALATAISSGKAIGLNIASGDTLLNSKQIVMIIPQEDDEPVNI